MATSLLATWTVRVALVLMMYTKNTSSFSPTIPVFSHRSFKELANHGIAVNDDNLVVLTAVSTKSSNSAAASLDFDFASPAGWDDYYQKQEQRLQQQLLRQATNGDTHDDDNTIDDDDSDGIVEWHSSVALKDLAALVPLHANCLLVGCGNSKLPETILQNQAQRTVDKEEKLSQQQHEQHPSRLVLMDTSSTCLEQLQRRYSNSIAGAGNSSSIMQMEYLCGDATRLSDYFGSAGKNTAAASDKTDGDDTDDASTRPFDVILDKGLCDAIWCGEGWDGPLERLFREAAKVLQSTATTTKTQPGRYILVCYRLSPSHKEFLTDVGQQVGFEWEFDLPPPLSNKRVTVSVASLVTAGLALTKPIRQGEIQY